MPVTSDLSPVPLILSLTFRYMWALRSPKAMVISKWWTFDSAPKTAALLYQSTAESGGFENVGVIYVKFSIHAFGGGKSFTLADSTVFQIFWCSQPGNKSHFHGEDMGSKSRQQYVFRYMLFIWKVNKEARLFCDCCFATIFYRIALKMFYVTRV